MIYVLLGLILAVVGISIKLQAKINDVNTKAVVNALLNALDKPKSVDILSLFHPKVWEIYKEYMSNPESWRSGHCTITNGTDTIWAENTVENRRFYDYSKTSTYEQINKQLTHYDQLLMDRLVEAVRNREKMISLKIFL
jgi:hypothetical protein